MAAMMTFNEKTKEDMTESTLHLIWDLNGYPRIQVFTPLKEGFSFFYCCSICQSFCC